MAIPTTTVRIDWAGKGSFGGLYDTVHPLSNPEGRGILHTSGASADFAGAVVGQLTIDLDNVDHAFDPDRQWCDNPSFENGVGLWFGQAIAGLTAAGTSITQVVDSAGIGAGTKAAEIVLSATLNSGFAIRIPYPFLAGVAHQIAVSIKSISGNLHVRAGLASEGAVADLGGTSADITAAWARYAGTYTPVADRTDVLLFVRTTTAAAATIRIDAVQVNPGPTINPFLEAPSRGELVPGRPVHFYSTLSGSDTARFFGGLKTLTPDPEKQTIALVARDIEGAMAAKAGFVRPGGQAYSARELRLETLGSFEARDLNMFGNPSFEVDLSGWLTAVGGTLTRITTDAAPGGGSACAQFVATGSGQMMTYSLRRPGFILNAQVRVSVWARCAAGPQTWKLGAQVPIAGGQANERSIVVGPNWHRFDVALDVPYGAASTGPVYVTVTSTAAGTILVDNAQGTLGTALWPYSPVGAGRWPNMVQAGGFDGLARQGWIDAISNLCANGGLDVNAAGWAGATRATTNPYAGAGHGRVAAGGTGTYALPGTYLAGVTYDLSAFVRIPLADSGTVSIGSAGTPGDAVSLLVHGAGAVYAWTDALRWTPLANRADAQISFAAGSQPLLFDNVMVTRADPSGYWGAVPFMLTGYGGSGAAPSTWGFNTAVPKFGSACLEVTTPAVAGAGIAYDFLFAHPYFEAGVAHAVTAWIRSTSAMPYKVGIAGLLDNGSFDEATATGTLTANVWTPISFSWTPAVDMYPWGGAAGLAGHVEGPGSCVLYAIQTNAVARTFEIDGVRVVPGAADDYELARWLVPAAAESDPYVYNFALSGSVAGMLSTLNALQLSNDRVRATMADPYWEYVLEDRASFAAKTPAASIVETIDHWSEAAIDADALIDVVAVKWQAGFTGDHATDYWAAELAPGAWPAPVKSIDGSRFYPDRSVADKIGPEVIRRYGVTRKRPTLTLVNEYALQALDLRSLVTVTIGSFLVRSAPFVILRQDLAITDGGKTWTTKWRLEEFPF